MGIEFRRPPLPAPTESLGEETTSGAETEVATNVTTRTDKTSHTIPEDGSPITISTRKTRDISSGHHRRQKSQTSLLIEYFEASRTGDKSRSKPSIRVKVTPSSHKKSGSGSEAIQITGIGSDRKPSYTRRISLGTGTRSAETGATIGQGIELSHSTGSNVSGRPPVEIEVLNDGSDVSDKRNSRGLTYAPVDSNVSSMPPDSMLEGETYNDDKLGRSKETYQDDTDYLKAPVRTSSKSRSDSRERITQKVMEKLEQTSTKPRKSSRSDRERSSKDGETELPSRERRRKSSRSHRTEEETISGAESSLLSSKPAASERSYRSDASQASRMTNNPRLLEMVEDTIKRMILPEINAIKEDQKVDRKLRNYDGSRKSSVDGDLERRVSKSSSSPNIASKPKVVLNRDENDPGVVLSRGDSERVKYRKSSRDSPSEKRPSSSRRSSGQSRRESHETEEKLRPRSSHSSNGLRGAAAAGLAGSILTAAALRHHDSTGDMQERRKRRSKSRSSRSRSTSVTETSETYSKSAIPPMPLASNVNDSDTTRASLLSEQTKSSNSADEPITVREVSRGSIGDGSPNSSRTPTRASVSRSLGMSHSNHSIDHIARSPKSPNGGISTKTRMAALAAAGLSGIALAKDAGDNHMDADGYGTTTTRRKISSPVQSVSSLKKNFEDEEPLVPHALQPQSTASRSSAGRLHSRSNSRTSLRSAESSPTSKADQQSRNASMDNFVTPAEQPQSPFRDTTPGAETTDEWFDRQHLVNDRYRNAMDTATNRDSYQTNPYPQDEKRFTMMSDDSYGPAVNSSFQGDKDVRAIGLSPNYVHTPHAAESAVASLMEPSTVDSFGRSAQESPRKQNGSYSDRMAEHLRLAEQDHPALYEGSTLSQIMPSPDRWAAIKDHARNLSGSLENVSSHEKSGTNAVRQKGSPEQHPKMSASGLPVADDPMPEIGHYDSQSDLDTNPSIIHGPLGGDATGKDTWPYTPEPPAEPANRDSQSTRRYTADAIMAAAGGGAAALAAASAYKAAAKDKREDQHNYQSERARNGRPEGDPRATSGENMASFRDEGYATDGRTRSAGGITPKQDISFGSGDVNDYKRAMDTQDLGPDDPITANTNHARNVSGNSHGMASPLYDSSTGKGLDRIQSHDVVALMDHLTVRDAQRNARDTEILVTLVRSAAEMRQSFDEMKKFIANQDKMIMQNTDRDAEYTAQKVLSGPRPQTLGSPRTPRAPAQSEEEIQTKRKGVLRRALKGLTGGKSAKDIARIEDMLMQILDNVEDLKQQSGGRPGLERSYTEDTVNSVDSYEKLRAGPGSGYEPEGQAGTSSTASQSGHFVAAPRDKQQFHSGYDGRRGSETRVSTVLEDDEDELEPHEHHVLNNQFENNERLLTPTQEAYNLRRQSPNHVSPRHAATNNSPEKSQKHRSTGSSSFVLPIPKVSRWSRTTASSAAPDPAAFDSPKQSREMRATSQASRSGSTLNQYDDGQYSLHEDDRIRSTQSLAREQDRKVDADTHSMRSHGSRMNRTLSPLIPSETSSYHKSDYYGDEDYAPSPIQEDEHAMLEDPKYQAHRNSLLLQHPQPRQGETPRHQNTLESQAQTFDNPAGTNSDLSQRTVSDFDPSAWGSAGTAGLARHRLTQLEPISPVSMISPAVTSKADNGPLMPQQQQSQKPPAVPPKIRYEEDDDQDDMEPQFSNSGFSKGRNYSYSSPYGSGHLLEPIQEVRYSLETDSGRISPEHIQLASAKAVDMRSPGRKITGPRPMTMGVSPRADTARLVDHAGTVRRKPVPRQGAFDDGSD